MHGRRPPPATERSLELWKNCKTSRNGATVRRAHPAADGLERDPTHLARVVLKLGKGVMWRMMKIDVGAQIEALEAVLGHAKNPAAVREALAILQRWQWDERIDDSSRLRARELCRQFRRPPADGLLRWVNA